GAVLVFCGRRIRAYAQTKTLAEESVEMARQRCFAQRCEQHMPVPICCDSQGPLCIRVLRSLFDLHAGLEATLCTINRDIELRGAKVMSGAERLRLFIRFWHSAEPLPVHAPSPPVTEHSHPIACRQLTLDDLGQPRFDRQVPSECRDRSRGTHC